MENDFDERCKDVESIHPFSHSSVLEENDMKLNDSNGQVQILIGVKEIIHNLAASMLSAENHIYLSMWCCDFTLPIYPPNLTMSDIMIYISKNKPNVKIRMLLNDGGYNTFPNKDKYWFEKYSNINICYIYMFNSNLGFEVYDNMMDEQERIRQHKKTKREIKTHHSGLNCLHQKWALIDTNHLFISGIDICTTYYSSYFSEKKNDLGYIWQDASTHVRNPSLILCQFFIYNFKTRGKISRTYSESIDTQSYIPYPLCNQFSAPFTEEDIYCTTIENSVDYVYFENQYLYITEQAKNKVGRSVLKRLLKAEEENDPIFKMFFITNWSYEGEPKLIERTGCKLLLTNSINRIDIKRFEKWLFVGTLKHSGMKAPVYVHTKLLMVDSKHIISSSANLCDRSLSDTNSDIELGIHLFNMPQTVFQFEQKLWKLHLNIHVNSPQTITAKSLFSQCIIHAPHKHSKHFHKSYNHSKYYGSPINIYNLTNMIGLVYFLGGKIAEPINQAGHFL
jgi:phosphatidylserine/phosphatidylglycerophosphate/cardiolipin synthase-like enzyme